MPKIKKIKKSKLKEFGIKLGIIIRVNNIKL